MAIAAVPAVVLRIESWIFVPVALIVVAALGLIDMLLALHPSDVTVERDFNDRVTVGETTTIAWSVRNVGSRASTVTVADAMWPSLQATRRSATITLEPGSGHRFGARITPTRRGRFPFDAITVRTTGPLLLVSRQATRSVPDTVAAMPAYPSKDLMRSRMRVPLDNGLRSVRARGTGTDFDQLREYRPGDDFRRIDWAASARSQTTVVRDYRSERNQFVVGLLDNGRTMAGTVAGAPRVEHAMDAVLGLTQVVGALGDNMGLVTFDSQVRGIVPARNAKSQLGRVAEAMFLLDPVYDESAFRIAFDTAASRFRRRSLFVVFTDLVDAALDTLLPALSSLTRTHLVLVAAVRDPNVAEWAGERGHATASEVFRSAAAASAIATRERTIARLRAVGVVVVDAQPGELAVDVVDQYLAFKAQGRL